MPLIDLRDPDQRPALDAGFIHRRPAIGLSPAPSDAGRMKPSSYYDRIVDVMEELIRFTVLLRPHAAQLVDRYSERKAAGVPVDPSTGLSSIAIDRR
jgi:hypothetical protein